MDFLSICFKRNFYTKSKKWTFNQLFDTNYKETIDYDRWKKWLVKGNKIIASNMPMQDSRFTRYYRRWVKNHGREPKGNDIVYELKGQAIDTVWDIKAIDPKDKDRLGYPTQKPEALLERIIEVSSNEGDIVLDAFCGCGTTIKVAKDLKRKFIGIDVSPTACRLMAKRIHLKKDEIIGMKYSIDELKELPPFEFQNWVVERIGGKVNPKKTSDMGIDGIVPISEYGANLPVEVKQHSISRPDVDKFETVLRRTKKKAGFVVGFKFSKGASEEIARCKNEEKLDIIAITIEELLVKNKIAK